MMASAEAAKAFGQRTEVVGRAARVRAAERSRDKGIDVRGSISDWADAAYCVLAHPDKPAVHPDTLTVYASRGVDFDLLRAVAVELGYPVDDLNPRSIKDVT